MPVTLQCISSCLIRLSKFFLPLEDTDGDSLLSNKFVVKGYCCLFLLKSIRANLKIVTKIVKGWGAFS